MLRITVENASDRVTLKLEGKLLGPWVNELENSWKSIRARPDKKPVDVDLSRVGYVGQQGKNVLEKMVHDGAHLIASGPLIGAVAEQIVSRANKSQAQKTKTSF